MKTCTRCRIEKPFTDFYHRSDRKHGRRSKCIKCCTEIDKGRKRAGLALPKTKETIRAANLKKLYGITIEDFEAMLTEQGGVCAVCAGPPMGKGRYHVDHNHRTGIIRGLLCHKCNVALGMVQDSVDHLARLIAYLQELS